MTVRCCLLIHPKITMKPVLLMLYFFVVQDKIGHYNIPADFDVLGTNVVIYSTLSWNTEFLSPPSGCESSYAKLTTAC